MLHLQQRPGTDVALLNGLMHVIIKKGWQDKAFIEERTEGFEEFEESVAGIHRRSGSSEITGVAAEASARSGTDPRDTQARGHPLRHGHHAAHHRRART